GEEGVLKAVESSDWNGRPDEERFSKEVMERIETAVNELPEKYRIVFHLRDVEGLTNQEVAKILGVSLPNAKARIHRTRLFLRNRLSDYFAMN
ncbi:MAG: RNA polymerase sigma factor, partial [Thermodesulfobacteriota bacterium]